MGFKQNAQTVAAQAYILKMKNLSEFVHINLLTQPATLHKNNFPRF